MTRGFHSRNATFSIRNYYNGALLYRKHLCHSGKDNIIDDDPYKGTSKSAEGYAARLTFGEAKKEGMNITIQWQDADSSSSKAVTDHFPNAQVMICGGRAGRAQKVQSLWFYYTQTFQSQRLSFQQQGTGYRHLFRSEGR